MCHVTFKLAVSRSRPSVPYRANFIIYLVFIFSFLYFSFCVVRWIMLTLRSAFTRETCCKLPIVDCAGVLLWEIFSGGETPYGKTSQRDIVDLICLHGGRLLQPPRCPDIMFDVMCGCWMTVRSLFCSVSLHCVLLTKRSHLGSSGGVNIG